MYNSVNTIVSLHSQHPNLTSGAVLDSILGYTFFYNDTGLASTVFLLCRWYTLDSTGYRCRIE